MKPGTWGFDDQRREYYEHMPRLGRHEPQSLRLDTSWSAAPTADFG